MRQNDLDFLEEKGFEILKTCEQRGTVQYENTSCQRWKEHHKEFSYVNMEKLFMRA